MILRLRAANGRSTVCGAAEGLRCAACETAERRTADRKNNESEKRKA